MPVPVPENAENVQFNGEDGKLEFDSSSSVKALAAFYRGLLKPLGWKEQPSVINKSTMVVMEFSRGGKELSFTAMQMGPKVNVTADGSGLVMANAKPEAATSRASDAAADKAVAENRLRAAGAETALHEFDRDRKASRHRNRDSPGTQRQHSGRAWFGARVLSRRTRQARVERIGGSRGRQA
jgi:hypothetical protein